MSDTSNPTGGARARLPALPAVHLVDAALSRWVQAVTERLEVREGSRGDAAERAVRVGDLGALPAGAQQTLRLRLGALEATLDTAPLAGWLDSTQPLRALAERLAKAEQAQADAARAQEQAQGEQVRASAQQAQQVEQTLEQLRMRLATLEAQPSASVLAAGGAAPAASGAGADDSADAAQVHGLVGRVAALRGQWVAKVDAQGAFAGFGLASTAPGAAPTLALRVDTAMLADGAVTTPKLADGSLGLAHFGAGLEPVGLHTGSALPTARRTALLAWNHQVYRWDGTAYVPAGAAAPDLSGLISGQDIQALAASKLTGQVSDAQIAGLSASKLTGQVGAAQLATGAVTPDKLATGAVTGPKLATGAVTGPKLASGAVTLDKLANNVVSDAYFNSGTVFDAPETEGSWLVYTLATRNVNVPAGGRYILFDAVVEYELVPGGVFHASESWIHIRRVDPAQNLVLARAPWADTRGGIMVATATVVSGVLAEGANTYAMTLRVPAVGGGFIRPRRVALRTLLLKR